jgi:hypothetical protein
MTVQTQKVINDNDSEVLDELRRQFNALLAMMETAANLAAIQTALGDGTVRSVSVMPDSPDRPRWPSP